MEVGLGTLIVHLQNLLKTDIGKNDDNNAFLCWCFVHPRHVFDSISLLSTVTSPQTFQFSSTSQMVHLLGLLEKALQCAQAISSCADLARRGLLTVKFDWVGGHNRRNKFKRRVFSVLSVLEKALCSQTEPEVRPFLRVVRETDMRRRRLMSSYNQFSQNQKQPRIARKRTKSKQPY